MGDETVRRHPPLQINRGLWRSLETIQQEVILRPEARQRLGGLLQAALRLEFAVIPVYLSAAFSLGQRNRAIAELITRVAIEEMLHFIVVANTMNAIGVTPDIEGAVPTYPCHIDVIEPPLHLEVKSFSPGLLTDMFLRIETPEKPIVFERALAAPAPTVGRFYEGIIDIIESDQIPGLFDIDPADRNVAIIPRPPAAFRPVAYRDDNDQGRYPLPASIDFAITDKASAVRHLKWVVDQGEGTSRTDTDPIDLSGLPAHYYRFCSIRQGRYLVKDSNAPKGYSYSGGSLLFDPADVHEYDPNARAADYAEHERLSRHMAGFNRNYSRMIDGLKIAFASRDETAAQAAYESSIASMRNMPRVAAAINRAAGEAGVRAGIPFEYQRV